MKITHIVFILLVGYMSCMTAQQSFTVQSKFYSTNDGLSHKAVHCLLKDKRGFLWIATRKGLNRFDGYRFNAFTMENAGLPFDDIHFIWQDTDGWLWVFAQEAANGIYFFNPVTFEIKSFTERFGNDEHGLVNQVFRAVPTADGAIWLGLRNGVGIARYHSSTGLQYLSFQQDSIVPIGPADRESVFCTKGQQLILVHPGGTQSIPENLPTNQPFIYTGITYTPYLNSILRTEGRKEFYTNDLQAILPPVITSTRAENSTEVHFVISPDLYFDGWSLLHRRAGALFHVAPYLADGVKAVLPEDNHRVWVGGHNGFMLLQVKPVLFTHIVGNQFPDQKQNKSCRGLWSDGRQLYMHFDEFGLYRYDLTTHASTHLFSHSAWGHFSLLHDDGFLYGGLSKGLYRINLQTDQVKHWALDKPVFSLYRLPNQQLLCGSNGLILFNEQRGIAEPFHQYNQFSELAQSAVDYMAADREGKIWICADSGFYAYDVKLGITGRYWRGGSEAFYLPATTFRHFIQDRDGVFWMATRDNGVVIWDREKGLVQKINHADGLSSDVAYAVYEDAQGQCWVSTDHGLNQIDKTHMHLRFWNMKDGIAYDEFNKFSHFQDPNGIMFFGGLDGVTQFDPSQFGPVKDDDPEPFYFCALQVFNSRTGQWQNRRNVYLQGIPLKLYDGDNLIRVDFAMLDLDQPDDIRYSWQLNGQDSTWHQVESPVLQLSRPAYGEYDLKIRGLPSQGIWKASELQLKLMVIPPFYLRTWFWICMTILLALGIWQYGRWRSFSQQQRALQLEQEVLQQTSTIRQQAEELKQLDELKSRFFANVSHELRTPLTLLLGPISSVLKKNKVDTADREMLEVAKGHSQQLMNLVGEILDLGKLTSGTLTVDVKPMAVAVLFDRLCAAFSSHADRIGVHYVIDCQVDERLTIEVDEKKFTAIVNNLLSNAFKFTPAGEHVIASLQMVQHQLLLRVSDTGPGIDTNDLPHIFDRYFQSKQPNAPIAGGTGIGLALCKEYAELLGGKIEVTSSTTDHKTEFTVWLPMVASSTSEASEINFGSDDSIEQEVQQVDAFHTLSHGGNKPEVLIVEDHDSLRVYIAGVLSPFYQVHQTKHGREAIDHMLLKTSNALPALIVSDIMMPVMDGFQLAAQLKSDDRFRHIPLVMLTARADMKDKLRALRIGVDDYLLKPFEEDELLARIHNLVQHARLRVAEGVDVLAGASPAGTSTASQEDQDWLMQLEDVVMKDMTNFNLSADMLADSMAISRTTLFRRVKLLTGLTAQQYVAEVRYRIARDLLETRRYSTVKSVAYSVGLRDVEHFSRQFRERFGKLPSAYLN